MPRLNEQQKELVIQYFLDRAAMMKDRPEFDNSKLMAGEPMYFFCKYCGWLADTVPENYIFDPHETCSQCDGLEEEGILQEALSRLVAVPRAVSSGG